VCICTEPFVGAARTHARLLGWPQYEPLAIPHPLQTLAADLVAQRADGLVARVVDRLIGNAG